jgi:PAS domain S-box-containing protein
MGLKFWSSGKAKKEPAIFIHDFKGTIIDVNKRGLEIFGYTKEEMLKLNLKELGTPISVAQGALAMKDIIIRGSGSFTGEYKTKDGKTGIASITSEVIEMNGRKVVKAIFIVDKK